MTLKNAIRIGKSIGSLLEVENGDSPGLICRQHLRLRVEINTRRPLMPGFYIARSGKDPLWIQFRYERLADYCTLCGLIGHRKFICPDPPSKPPANYNISLLAASSSYPRIVPQSNLEHVAAGSRAPLQASHGAEPTQLQLVPRIEQQLPAVPFSPTYPPAPVHFDAGHVARLPSQLRIGGSSVPVATSARGPASSHHTKFTMADKGKSPLYPEKSSSTAVTHPPLNAPTIPHPYQIDFDKPPNHSLPSQASSDQPFPYSHTRPTSWNSFPNGLIPQPGPLHHPLTRSVQSQITTLTQPITPISHQKFTQPVRLPTSLPK
ncbi:hypothetical protein SLA2020_435070 [Shorea laevis]